MMTPVTDELDPRSLARPLLAWFALNARDLPWRGLRDPYRVWVSEVMLQQTQVETVLGYYEPFLERFPTLERLASAPEADVLAAWSGLGFYRRARNLHRAARQVVEELGGELPRDPKRLGALPGLGRYTVGAILSLTYGDRLPILDGNVARVLSRVFRVDGPPSASATRKELWRLAEATLPDRDAGRFNESLMELGALVCRPTAPDCDACPLRSSCGAHRAGDPEAFPQPKRRPAVPEVERAAVFLLRPDDRFRLDQRPAQGLLASMWELPSAELKSARQAQATAQALARRLGARGQVTSRGSSEHRFSHRLWRTHVFRLRTRARAALGQGRWVAWEELESLAVPTASRKILKLAWGEPG